MAFVFSFWYIVMALLVAGITACMIVFVKMDQKDRVLIEEFIKAQQPAEEKVEVVEAQEVVANK